MIASNPTMGHAVKRSAAPETAPTPVIRSHMARHVRLEVREKGVLFPGECDTATGLCSCFVGSLGEDCAQREASERLSCASEHLPSSRRFGQVPLTNAIEIAIVFGLLGISVATAEAGLLDARSWCRK